MAAAADTISVENDYAPVATAEASSEPVKRPIIRETFRAKFELLFRCEGAHKVT